MTGLLLYSQTHFQGHCELEHTQNTQQYTINHVGFLCMYNIKICQILV